MLNVMTFNGDIKIYPPIINLIKHLLKEQKKVIFIGKCSDKVILSSLISLGLNYKEVNVISSNPFYKFYLYCMYRYEVKQFLSKQSEEVRLWIFGFSALGLLGRLVKKYKSIVYLFEFTPAEFPVVHKIIGLNNSASKTLKLAHKVVCCESTRSLLTQKLYGLEEIPVVIPNKVQVPDLDFSDLSFLDGYVAELLKKFKVIIYQGGITYPERRLDEFCGSINYLPDDFAIIILGGSSEYKSILQKNYESERVVFLDFISFPDYLKVTRNCYIGFLSYHPQFGNITQVINTTFCAPNKIFEYTKFGLPILSNKLPSIQNDMNDFKFGLFYEDFTAENIAKSILKIDENYDFYRTEAFRFYASIDVEFQIDSLLD